MNDDIRGFGNGMDFVDALHICLVAEGDVFVTFDRDLARPAKRQFSRLSIELAY